MAFGYQGSRITDIAVDEVMGIPVIADERVPEGWVILIGPPGCPRGCGPMEWRHSSWQCPSCKYKEGCCG